MDYLDKLLELAGANEHAIIFTDERYKDALIGYGANKRAIYDYDIMVSSVMSANNISLEDAISIVDDTILKECNNRYSPIVMYHFTYERPESER